MSIRFLPPRRFTDPQERLSYKGLDLLARGGLAIVDPNSVGLLELNEDDLIAAFGALTTASENGTITMTEATTVAALGSAILPDYDQFTEEIPLDSIVTCDQHDLSLHITGFIQKDPDGSGGFVYKVRFVAKNFNTTSQDVVDGYILKYALFSGVPQVLPRTPNCELLVTAGQEWLDDDGALFEPQIPVSVGGMNNTAKPRLDVTDHSITEVELRSNDMDTFGTLHTGRRTIFTLASNTAVPVGAATLLGFVTFNGAAGPNVITGQPVSAPLLMGFVSASNGTTTIAIYARNNTFSTINLSAGLQIKVFAY